MKTSPSSSQSSIQRRERVHDAVRALLGEQGFRITMDAVATRAGCSKQTLYAHFGSKQNLLRDVMHEHMDLATSHLQNDARDLRDALMAFALQHLARLSDPHLVTTCQLLNAEARQYPEEAIGFFRNGPQALQIRLADWLGQVSARGQLRHDDPHCMAELLLGMIAGLDFERQRFNAPHRATAEQRRAWAEFSVGAFLRAFAPVESFPDCCP